MAKILEGANDMSECLDIEVLNKDPICQKWISYSMAEDDKHPAEWYRKKQSFWDKNQNHLQENGLRYGSNMGKALDDVAITSEKELEGKDTGGADAVTEMKEALEEKEKSES